MVRIHLATYTVNSGFLTFMPITVASVANQMYMNALFSSETVVLLILACLWPCIHYVIKMAPLIWRIPDIMLVVSLMQC